MHLKKLHLLGFKSFADDTTLEFGPGITAVVGPNGSGKSNIVDAMLWALGERSAKALRGHNATDVIFNGTSSRKPTGRAEVNLFFDNESGVLPINFKEVQVSRKLYRDGDGEYGLCGSKCRLRDMLDLFLDTGVGPDAGCIISQGEIDAILSARPEDRRGLIEGAAGVQKYHSRRTETRKRLEKVVIDLIRICDITSELEGQIEPLALQAEVAREYDTLVSRLRELQLDVLSRDYLGRKERLETLQDAKQSSDAKVGSARLEIESLEQAESITTRQLRELERAVEAFSIDLTALVARLKSVEGEIAVMGERRRNLTAQQEYTARELGGLRGKMTGFVEQIDALKNELQRAQNESSGLNQSAANAEAKLGGANARLSEAARELQLLQSRVIETMRRGQNGRERLAAASVEARSLETRRAELEKLLQSGGEEATALNGLRDDTTNLLKGIKAKLSDNSAIEVARTNLEAARQNLTDLQRALSEKRENRARLQSRANVLRELEESLEGFQGGTKAILTAANRGELSPDYITIADAIKAPKELELAMETALGGNLNNLICPDNESAKIAVEYLKRTQRGRATFLPLASLRPSYLSDRTLDVLHDKSVLGLANELIECARENEVAIDHLLSRFIIVQTLEDAIRLARKCESGARLVSLEGELVLPAGAISGGQEKIRSSGLLARKRELEEFQEKIDALEAEVENGKGEVQRAHTLIGTVENELRAATEAQNEIRNQIARQEREVETIARDLNRNKQQREAVESQLRHLQSSLAAKTFAFDELQKNALAAEAEAKTLESAVEAARLIVGQRQSEKDSIASEVAEVRGQFGARQERSNAMKRSLADLERNLIETRNLIRQKEAELERAIGEDKQIVSREASMVAQLSELQNRQNALEANLDQSRSARAETLEKVGEIGQHLKATRETLRVSEEELHRVEVRLAATLAEMSDMERRLRDEFGIGSPPAQDENEGQQAFEERGEALDAEAIREEEENDKTGNRSLDDFLLAISSLGGDGFNRRAALVEIEGLSRKIGTLGSVNMGAIAQYEAVKERHDFLTEQKTDLEVSKNELDAIIAEIDGRIRERFTNTFKAVQEAFAFTFERVFGGGKTHLALTDPENLLETGIELRVTMPGKASQDISLLSGGERALTALSFMMAILKVRPAPFVILDEVDAPLDQSNVGRFTDLLRHFTATTQFIVITHNNGTMQAADVLYGVTQQEAGVSTLMSVRLAEEAELVRS